MKGTAKNQKPKKITAQNNQPLPKVEIPKFKIPSLENKKVILGFLTILLVTAIFATHSLVKPQTKVAGIAITPMPSAPLPSNWSMVSSEICGLSIPTPPQQAPYITPLNSTPDSGAQWQFDPTVESQDPLFTRTITLMYINLNSPNNQYTPAEISLSCAPNTSNVTTDALIASYEKNLPLNSETVKEKKPTTIWEKNTIEITTQDSQAKLTTHYLFATPTFIYRIESKSPSQDPFVKETTEKILHNIHFFN